jgi:hypothetical protein
MSESREFELKVKERMVLSSILPAQGDILTLRLVMDLKKDVLFSEQEHKDFEITITEGRMTWDITKDLPKKFAVGSTMLKLIQDTLGKLNKDRQLTIDQVPLYDLFMDPTKE